MSARQQRPPKSVYLLADHIDVALAACEDLLRLPAAIEPGDLLRLELTAITHLLQARHRSRELYLGDARLAEPALLFLAGTEPFERSEPMKSEPENGAPAMDESYLLGGRVPISTLRHLASRMVDALEFHYVINADDQTGALFETQVLPAQELWTVEDRTIALAAA
jgi:hypothetical protein